MKRRPLAISACGVERKIRVGLGRNPAGNDLQNVHAEQDQEIIHDLAEQRFARRAGFARIGDGFGDQLLVGRHLRGLENQRRIGRGILRGVLLERDVIAGVGDDFREPLQLVELIGPCRSLLFLSCFSRWTH